MNQVIEENNHQFNQVMNDLNEQLGLFNHNDDNLQLD
jgi:hypothetical protein